MRFAVNSAIPDSPSIGAASSKTTGDGKTDILWRCTDASDVTCTNGTVVIWEMNGGTILAEVGDYVVATQWTLVQ